ncbi:MAG: hypothetical protein QMD06_03000, partial [Candidatus Altarchaeum sp.]|nr:hypothetical protein [Candidatus Altarchaeum sp.]
FKSLKIVYKKARFLQLLSIEKNAFCGIQIPKNLILIEYIKKLKFIIFGSTTYLMLVDCYI